MRVVKALKGAGLLKLGGGDAAPASAKPVKATRAKATKVCLFMSRAVCVIGVCVCACVAVSIFACWGCQQLRSTGVDTLYKCVSNLARSVSRFFSSHRT